MRWRKGIERPIDWTVVTIEACFIVIKKGIPMDEWAQTRAAQLHKTLRACMVAQRTEIQMRPAGQVEIGMVDSLMGQVSVRPWPWLMNGWTFSYG